METRRPTTPEAEEILGLYYPVLDHGFVSLVDYMGSDESIEHAARVSYGYGTRRRSATRGLIRYLRRHRRHLHTTPSEMVELTASTLRHADALKLRQVNEDTLAFQHTRIVDVYRNGPKPVFRMVLEDVHRSHI